MSTSNPFDKLNVKREEEEEEEPEFKEVKGKVKNVPYGIEQKKKKVRPKEQEKVKEEGGEEGFEEVPSKTKKRRPENVEGEEGEESKGHKKRRGVNFNTQEERDYRLKDKPRRGRQYDRQSGTGRGKEIAKGGAGGKGTWGDNPKNIAQNYNDDDYYFDSALNPDKYKERRRPRREYKKENEEKEGEEKVEEGETKEDKKEEKKEKYKPRPIEIKEEDKLHRPENEMSLDDYLKSKEKPKEEEKEVERIKDGNPLKKTEKKKEEILGTTGAGKKKEKKKKEKKNQKEEINVDFEVGGGNDYRGGDRRRGGRGKGRGGYFHFKAEDFPEFK